MLTFSIAEKTRALDSAKDGVLKGIGGERQRAHHATFWLLCRYTSISTHAYMYIHSYR